MTIDEIIMGVIICGGIGIFLALIYYYVRALTYNKNTDTYWGR